MSGRATGMAGDEAATLVVLGGLPGTGKTTVARLLALRWRATQLRIDTIEQAIRDSGIADVGAAGYAVANALAAANLGPGRMVVADGVNPVPESRAGWRAVARRAGARLVEVELICGDAGEHRRRVEGRVSDIPGLALPSWSSVLRHRYAPWAEPHLIVDTARLAPDAVVAAIEARLAAANARPG